MAYDGGEAFLRVTPNFAGLAEKIRAEVARINSDVPVRVVADTGRARGQLDEVSRSATALGRQSPTVKVKADTADAQRQMNLLRDAIVFLGPAAVPVAAVAGGALLGLVPVAATVALGIKGISDELKSGQLAGTQYGDDIEALSTEFETLKTNAASGLLSGVDTALKNSQPLFAGLNQDVSAMSAQLGQIAGGLAPALLSILNALNPLFVTFGNLLASGATKLEHWVTSSGDIQSFVAYVQVELPTVVHAFGELLQTVVRLGEALAPVGHAVVSGIGALASALNSIPLGVLQVMVPLLLAGYAALRVYRGVDAIVTRFSSGMTKIRDAQNANATAYEAAAARQNAASLEVQATAAAEAAAVAEAKAAEARAAATTAAALAASTAETDSLFASEGAAATGAAGEMTAAFEGMNSLFANEATVAAATSEEVAASLEAQAVAARLAATQIAGAARLAGAGIAEGGAKASAGWASLLGPVAAVGIGILLLTSIFGGNNDAARHNAEIMNGYAESLKQSANGLAEVNIQQTAKNLQDSGAVKLMKELADNNVAVDTTTRGARGSTDGLRLSQAQLVLAVNGTQKQYDSLYGSLIKVAAANRQDSNSDSRVAAYNATGQAALNLAGKIKQLRDDFTGEMKVQAELADIQRQSQIAIDGGASATAEQARQLGLTSDAYLAAQTAAKKNTDQTNLQAAAFQLANDGGSLLAVTLDKLSGKKLSYAQTLNSFQSQLATGGPKGTPGTPGTGNAAAVAAATSRRANALEAETIAQTKYNEALAKGNTDAIAAAHLRLARAKTAVANATNALNAAEKSGGGTPSKAADTRLKGLSAAAIQNRNDIISLVSGAEQVAEAYGKMTGSSEKGRQKLIDLRTQLINSRVALGENRAEVTKFVDSILKIPAKVPPTKLDVQHAEAKKKIDELQQRINLIKQGKAPFLDANSTEAKGVIKALQLQIDELRGKKVPLTVADHVTPALRVIQGRIDHLHGKTLVISAITVGPDGISTKGSAGKTIFAQARGAVMDFYGNGGLREHHVAQIAPAGAMRVWNEPETGGEGYVPLAPSKRQRSRAITSEIAARLGGVASFAAGGFSQLDTRNIGTSRGIRDVHIDQTIVSPLPETASVLGPRGMEQAAYALDNA